MAVVPPLGPCVQLTGGGSDGGALRVGAGRQCLSIHSPSTSRCHSPHHPPRTLPGPCPRRRAIAVPVPVAVAVAGAVAVAIAVAITQSCSRSRSVPLTQPVAQSQSRSLMQSFFFLPTTKSHFTPHLPSQRRVLTPSIREGTRNAAVNHHFIGTMNRRLDRGSDLLRTVADCHPPFERA